MTTFTSITPHLKTNDLAATIRFYTDVLGFTVDPNTLYPQPCLAGQLWIEVQDVMSLHSNVAGRVKIEWGPEVYSLRSAIFTR